MDIFLFSPDLVMTSTIYGFLTDLGHNVIPVHSGPELLDRFETDPDNIDLVITDISTRCVENKNLLHQIHRLRPHAPIILATNHTDILPSDQAVGCGVYAYLHKPVSLSELELLLIRKTEAGSRHPLRHAPNTGSSPLPDEPNQSVAKT